MSEFENSKKQIEELVEMFKTNEHIYTATDFDEENTKSNFINKFFIALGWDVNNDLHVAPQYRDVVFEDNVVINGKTKAPDYSFGIGADKSFFVEAKAPHENIENNKEHAFQLKRYTWSAKLPVGLLTDFEELAIYVPKTTPKKSHHPNIDRIKYYHYSEYVENWEEIYNIYSKEAVLSGKFDNYFSERDTNGNNPTTTVDDEFLKTIENWRLELAKNIALRNIELTVDELNFAVQLIIDRIIFLRIAEDRGIEKYGQLKKLTELARNEKDNYPVYEAFIELCRDADGKYNSGLFHFSEEKDISLSADTLTPSLKVDDSKLKKIIDGLYYPDCPYEFSMISTEILGNIYEQFLGKVIRLTDGHQAKVEDKPLVKKAGGVYYTPQYIVEYIVENTIGKLLNGKTPNKVTQLKFVDPACGSGSFLLGIYQKLLDWHLEYYSNLDQPPKNVIYSRKDGIPRLTIQEKKKILLNNIYGVDIDSQAVEVTKLSLLLKVLEDENKDLLEAQQKLIKERALPYLGDNIKCGNSLISPNDLDFGELSSEEIFDINPFDWKEQFSEIFENGGFDAIIGNPPYVNISKIPSNQKEILKSNYESEGRFDLYVLFMEKAINLLKQRGLHSFIVPDKLCNQKYGTNIRNIMLNLNIEKIVDLRPVKVFKGVSVKNIIYILKNNNVSRKLEIFKPTAKEIDNNILENNSFTLKQEFYSNIPQFMFRLDYKTEYNSIINKINNNSIKLKEICYCAFGFQPGNLSKFTFNVNENPERKNEHPDEVIKKFIRGRNIKPYYIDFSDDYVFYLPDKLHRPAFRELFEYPKIVISEISKDIEATLDENKFYGNEKVIHVLPWKYMRHVDEKIIRRRGIQFDENNINNSEEYCLKFILPLLNSKLMQFYFKITLSDDLNVYPDNVKELPILIADNTTKKMLINYCDKLLDLTESLVSCKTPNQKNIFELQIKKINEDINQLIYELYDLKDEEIEIVENEVGDS